MAIKHLTGVKGETPERAAREESKLSLAFIDKNILQARTVMPRITTPDTYRDLKPDGNSEAKGLQTMKTGVRMFSGIDITIVRNVITVNNMQGAKTVIHGILGSLGSPYPRKGYGFRAFIVGVIAEGMQSKCHYSTNSFPKFLGGIQELMAENIKNNNFINRATIKIISSIETLITAYEIIKSKPGNMTPGADKLTLDSISLKYLTKVSSELKEGKFEFSPVKRVYISKPGIEEKRPLSVSSLREKIAQKALQMVLEAIFEPSFLDCSHGFRPNRGTHTALLIVDQQFRNIT